MRVVARPSIRASIDEALRRVRAAVRALQEVKEAMREVYRCAFCCSVCTPKADFTVADENDADLEEGVLFDRAPQPWRVEVVPEGSIHERHF